MRKAIFMAAAICALLAVTGCVSPVNEGEGTVYIGLSDGKTVVPTGTELRDLRVEVTFTGPGGTVNAEFGASGGSVRLGSGTWRVTAKAYNAEPRLRAVADTRIEVKPGSRHTLAMTACIGIKTEQDLIDALGAGGINRIGHDISNLRNGSPIGDLIVLENDITLSTTIPVSSVLHSVTSTAIPYTLITEPGRTRTITRNAAVARITVNSGSLTLGKSGESGSLVLDGGGAGASTNGHLLVVSGGAAVMDGNTVIKNCVASALSAGGVSVSGGTFTMNSGTITGNSTPDNGGGVRVSTGTFTYNGGTISGNTAGQGAQVYKAAAATVNGSAVSGNTITGLGAATSGTNNGDNTWWD